MTVTTVCRPLICPESKMHLHSSASGHPHLLYASLHCNGGSINGHSGHLHIMYPHCIVMVVCVGDVMAILILCILIALYWLLASVTVMATLICILIAL